MGARDRDLEAGERTWIGGKAEELRVSGEPPGPKIGEQCLAPFRGQETIAAIELGAAGGLVGDGRQLALCEASVDVDVPEESVAFADAALLARGKTECLELRGISEGRIEHVIEVHEFVVEPGRENRVKGEAVGSEGNDTLLFAFEIDIELGAFIGFGTGLPEG